MNWLERLSWDRGLGTTALFLGRPPICGSTAAGEMNVFLLLGRYGCAGLSLSKVEHGKLEMSSL